MLPNSGLHLRTRKTPKPNQNINSLGAVIMFLCRLVIVSVQPDTDYGVYKCQATNILGTTEDVIEVSGEYRSFIVTM